MQQLVDALNTRGHPAAVAWHTDTHGLTSPSHAIPSLTTSRLVLYTSDVPRSRLTAFDDLLVKLRPDVVHFHAFTAGAGLGHARVLREHGIPYVVTFHTPAMACPRGTWLLFGAAPCDGRLEVERCTRCVLHSRGWPSWVAAGLAKSRLPAARLPDGPWVPRLGIPSLMRLRFQALRDFLEGAATVVACADFVRDKLVANGIALDRIEVHRQALAGTTHQRTLQRPPASGSRVLRAGFFGRIARIKGPDLLVRAAERLRAAGRSVEVELVGPVEPGEQDWFEREVRGDLPWVRYRGALRGEALQHWLSEIDLIVVPSRWLETGPLTLLEAWDAGRVVVGCDSAGIGEFMRPQGQAALLFPSEDVAGLAAAIERAQSGEGYATEVTIPGAEELTSSMVAIYERAVGSVAARDR